MEIINRLICKFRGHEWGTHYKSSGGREVCTRCGFVTEATMDIEVKKEYVVRTKKTCCKDCK